MGYAIVALLCALLVRDGTDMDLEEIDKTIDEVEYIMPARSVSRAV